MANYSKMSTKSSLSSSATSKVKTPKLSARSSSKAPSPLTSMSGKKSYAKNKTDAEQFGIISFGMTGQTGRD